MPRTGVLVRFPVGFNSISEMHECVGLVETNRNMFTKPQNIVFQIDVIGVFRRGVHSLTILALHHYLWADVS